jgi:hypothetical protein
MTSLVEHGKGQTVDRMHGIGIPNPKKGRSNPKTTFIEKILLVITIIILPMENGLPTVGGRSVVFLLFAVIGCYVFLNRLQILMRVIKHPVILTAFGLILVGVILETYHTNSSYDGLFRFGQMVFGGILVASLCRDKEALRASFYGYLVASLWLAILIFLTSYSSLSVASAIDFHGASVARDAAFVDNPLEANLNAMARVTGIGAVVALSFALAGTGAAWRRNMFLVGGAFFLIATFLPMSRGAVLSVIVAGAAIMFAYGMGIRIILMLAVLGIGIIIWVPDVVLSRMSFSTEKSASGKLEARAKIYLLAIEHFPEYFITGLGEGNFWGPWGLKNWMKKKYLGRRAVVIGPHSCFIAVTIYWGIAGLLAYLAMVYQAYRCFPNKCRRDALSLCLLGLSLMLLMFMMNGHGMASKEFSLGLGLLVSCRCWVWPQGVVPALRLERKIKSLRQIQKKPSTPHGASLP